MMKKRRRSSVVSAGLSDEIIADDSTFLEPRVAESSAEDGDCGESVGLGGGSVWGTIRTFFGELPGHR